MTSQRMETEQQLPPQAAMLQMIAGFWLSRTIYVAAKLGLADLISEGPKTAAELAEATNTHAPSLYRVVRALASAGIFSEDGEGRFHMTPLATTLQTGVPGSLRSLALTELGEEHYPAWENVLHSVKTGEIAFDHKFGMPIWEFFGENPENAAIFNDAMTNLTSGVIDAIMAAYDFSGYKTIADIGGGQGSLITTILKAYPDASGILFDMPVVAESGRERIRAQHLEERCEVVGGSFFDEVPAGADAYILKWIIHDWEEERAVALLKNCRKAMKLDSKLLLVEVVLPGVNEPHFGKFIDLNMLVMTGGRERTEEEYRELYRAAGFELTRVVPTESPFCVIEGVPIK